ncbi:MAG: TVP38/TMEM64 family protein [Reyranella sp.]|uniref:TVP38/TMEM64 family protein n=1 Tax=Reyranella sp. TaxID=1929291 RepID=UPI001ACBEB98|nr:TVP38/TMEM64 family protein [Reyranella sp.]MBN9086740.1 TVP38/TMEM64 family protein [Reyranella sp.]
MSNPVTLKRLLPLLVIAGLFAAFFGLGFNRYLSLDSLRDNEVELRALVARHPALSAAAFIVTYAAVVGLSLPVGALLTMAGGFLFGLWIGAGLSVVGATAGAIVIFLIARVAVGDLLRARAGPFMARMTEGFERNAFNYLLLLRLVPVFPFWAVNLASALLGMNTPPFVAATAIGIIPGTLAYAAIGDGLGLYFRAGSEAPLSEVFTPEMIALRVGLALIALLPIAIRWAMKRWHR